VLNQLPVLMNTEYFWSTRRFKS